MGRTALSLLAAAIATPLVVRAHPICYYGARNPVLDYKSPGSFCEDLHSHSEGFCCDQTEEAEAEKRYGTAKLSDDCEEYHKQVACGVCHPFSGHLFARTPELVAVGAEGMTMTHDFCKKYTEACSEMDFPEKYCELHTLGQETDDYWSYPLKKVVESEFDATGVQRAFPSLDKDDIPEYPMFMEMTPDGKYWWIAGITGKIVQVMAGDPEKVDDIVMDMTPIDSFSKKGMVVSKEEGLLGFAIGPGFTGLGSPFYVSYTYYDPDLDGEQSEKQSNRLSKFTYNGKGDVGKEEVLITTTPKATQIHAGGWVGFKPSAKKQSNSEDDLYWAVGDGGPQNDLRGNAQNLDTYHGKIVRITVPRDGTGYTSPDGNAKGDICTYGHRNVFRCGFDSLDDTLYCGEIGHNKIEEVNIIECGKGYGWNRFEGDLCHRDNEFDEAELGDCNDASRDFQSPYYQYCHPGYDSSSDDEKYTGGIDICGDNAVTGMAIIGGLVYRGQKYADILYGKYIFTEFQQGGLHYLSDEFGMVSAGSIIRPDAPLVTAFAEDLDGEVYIVEYKGDIYHLPCGSLCESSCLPAGSPPSYESVGCYEDSKTKRVLAETAPACAGQDAMSPDICAAYCSTVSGATHFGVEYAYECYCGTVDTSKLTEAKGKCTSLCQGTPDQLCGGSLAIDIFTLGEITTTPPTTEYLPGEVEGATHVNCYKDDGDARIMRLKLKDPKMTAAVCYEECLGNEYFGLQHGHECWCGTSEKRVTQHGPGACDAKCEGGDELCGGYFVMTTYKYDKVSTPPTTSGNGVYIGCFHDEKKDRVFTAARADADTKLDADKCLAYCSEKKAAYFGLQWGVECWCGKNSDDYTRHGKDKCDYVCSGAPGDSCGGYDKMDIFEINY